MYKIHYAHTSFNEMIFSAVWRGISRFFHKIIFAILEARAKEAGRIIARYQK